MGRPVASISNRRFAVALANLLTRSTGCPHNAIARSGKCSIFSLLRVIRPSIVRDSDTGPRDGISEVEFNKALQVFCSTGFEVIEFKNLEFKNLEFMKIVYSLQMQFAINKRCQQRSKHIPDLNPKSKILYHPIYLQAAGYLRYRNRSRGVARREHDPLGTGIYMFRSFTLYALYHYLFSEGVYFKN